MLSKLYVQELYNNNPKTLILSDASAYNPQLPAQNCILEVAAPGKPTSSYFRVRPGFKKILNSSLLDIAPAASETDLTNLPDGIYYIRYSIQPNTQIFVEYEILRNTLQLNRYFRALNELYTERPRLATSEFHKKREHLRETREMIDSAKYRVDDCGHTRDGLDMYNEAKKQLDEYFRCYCKI